MLDSPLAIPEVNMPVVSRGALLVATASMATCVLAGPGAAYADTSTELTAAEVAAEFKTVSDTSAKAAAAGWKANLKLAVGSFTGNEFLVVDTIHGAAYVRYNLGGEPQSRYIVVGRGTYNYISDPDSREALKMMRRPSVKYVFTSDKSTSLDGEDGVEGMSPGHFLDQETKYPATKTVHDDGSTDYRLSEDGDTMTVHVTAAGVLASADYVSHADKDHDFTVNFGYGYGPQKVALPTAGMTISDAWLNVGLAYLNMAPAVKYVTGEAATDALDDANGHQVAVSLLRNVTKDDVRSVNDMLGVHMIKTKSVSGGIRVYAKNPWTHRTAAFTLKASGKKVTVAKK
ncbi:hypothetical protein ODJ79_25195 [Actinoplanes sp. KI2]|uniref:hypothetical protein n=1 Tax=Actinoplanes sp. KI2 TaxID=2983315 RepID=UPI0021D59831|nr:hypothetical protein [Actinoplanes sp. KI2]MCU7727038.1 hypothetical protein [Actinoplanes sp. KI2]